MMGENKEEYLEAIFGLLEDGRRATTNDVASCVGVSAASATQMLKKLHDEGYVEHIPYKGVQLTKTGIVYASNIKRKHRLLERFLHDILKIDKRAVHDEACRLEHGISDIVADGLDRLLGYPKTCPDDRKPIPRQNAQKTSTYPLSEAPEGAIVAITAIKGTKEFRSKMRTMGMSEGKRARVIAQEPFGGPIVVKTGNTRITIGRNMSSRIRVMDV
jgi:DtxR family Mn-dependent transcriptional regulator